MDKVAASEGSKTIGKGNCCLGCGMGLFFEGVSVGDGEGDGIVAAGLGASETEEEADEAAAEN